MVVVSRSHILVVQWSGGTSMGGITRVEFRLRLK
jgi:hypothetical protein